MVCANFCDQITRVAVHFLRSFCMGSCVCDIFYLFQKHCREHNKKNTTSSKGFPLGKIVPEPKLVPEKNVTEKNVPLSNFFPQQFVFLSKMFPLAKFITEFFCH